MLPDITMQEITENLKFLKQLAKEYPTADAAAARIIARESMLRLPKGTEHFMSDLHGEADAFTHILNNASGVIKEKVDAVLGEDVPAQERAEFATLIYYPAQKLAQLKPCQVDLQEWYRLTMMRLVKVCRLVASKHTRTFVRKNLPSSFKAIADELMHAHFEDHNRESYHSRIISSIVEVGRADLFIEEMSEMIKKLAVYKLHIVGDLFDRGKRPDIILDMLMQHHDVDIQWGNHDVQWLGAAAGGELCIAGVVRITLAYNNPETLEDGYGISLRPLSVFAEEMYKDADVSAFMPKCGPDDESSDDAQRRIARMHKAIFIIACKLESAAIARNPDFHMQDRDMLHRINYVTHEIDLNGEKYMLEDCDFPTVDPQNPAVLSAEEAHVMHHLCTSFAESEKLARHAHFLMSKGGLYHTENGNLMFHGAIPMTPEGKFTTVHMQGCDYSGRSWLDFCDRVLRRGFAAPQGSAERTLAQDLFWYLWCGRYSPIFAREKMTTFEQRYLSDKELYKEQHKEKKDPYYDLIENEDEALAENTARKILREFHQNPETSHIINGHIPVLAGKGENPIKAGGKLIVIDGGFCKAYHSRTGIAGYTLVFSSRSLSLRCHEPFETTEKAIAENKDIISSVDVFERMGHRLHISDTDEGRRYRQEIRDLQMLMAAYEFGVIKEK